MDFVMKEPDVCMLGINNDFKQSTSSITLDGSLIDYLKFDSPTIGKIMFSTESFLIGDGNTNPLIEILNDNGKRTLRFLDDSGIVTGKIEQIDSSMKFYINNKPIIDLFVDNNDNGAISIEAADDNLEGGQLVLKPAINQPHIITIDSYGNPSMLRFLRYDKTVGSYLGGLELRFDDFPFTTLRIGDPLDIFNPFVMGLNQTKTIRLNTINKLSTDFLPSGFYNIQSDTYDSTLPFQDWGVLLHIRHDDSTVNYATQLISKNDDDDEFYLRKIVNDVPGDNNLIYTDKYMTNEFSKASVRLSTDTAYVIGSPNIIPFDTVEFITNASLSNGTITINQTGYYAFYGSVMFSPNTALSTSDRVYLEIYINNIFTHGRFVYGNGTTNLETLEIYQAFHLNAGDSISLYVFSEVGGGTISSWQMCTRMQIIRIH